MLAFHTHGILGNDVWGMDWVLWEVWDGLEIPAKLLSWQYQALLSPSVTVL